MKHRELNRTIQDSAFQLDAEITGYCPVQALGHVAGHEFYFRARGNDWTFALATGNVDATDINSSGEGFFRTETCGNKPAEAGWMPLEEAERIIRLCVAEFLQRQNQ